MRNLIYELEGQRFGSNIFKRTECSFKDLYGFNEDESEVAGCPIFSCRFSPLHDFRDIVALANEDGQLEIRNTAKKVHGTVTQAHNNAIFDLTWMNQSPRIITASGDYSASLWDCGSGTIKNLFLFKGHTGSLKTIACHPTDDEIFATGGRDGSVLVWDCRDGKDSIVFPDKKILTYLPSEGHKANKSVDSVTSVIFLNDHSIVSSSAGEGILKVWDTRRTYSTYRRLPTPSHTIPPPGDNPRNGYSCIVLSPCSLFIYANCVDNNIYRFSVGNYDFSVSNKYTGHEVSSFYIKHCLSPDGKYLVSGSGDCKAYVWHVSSHSNPIATFHGHSAEVTAVHWSSNPHTKLVTCSDDTTFMIWKLNPHDKSDKNILIKGTVELHENTELNSHRGKCFRSCWLACEKANYHSPVKKNPTLKILYSPSKVSPSKKSAFMTPENSAKRRKIISPDELASPTCDLPNYVLDGTSPHQHRCPKKEESNQDWLTQLQQLASNRTTPQRAAKRLRRSSSASKSADILKYIKKTSRKPKCLNFHINDGALKDS